MSACCVPVETWREGSCGYSRLAEETAIFVAGVALPLPVHRTARAARYAEEHDPETERCR